MNEVVIYKSIDNQVEVLVNFNKETVWLSREQMATLFDRDRTVISRHIRNIFQEHELVEDMVSAKFAHTTPHGAIKDKTQQKETTFYSLDVIISVGYRVKSLRGTQFRQWANQQLKNILIKGYAVNQSRLNELGKLIQLVEQNTQSDSLPAEETKGLLTILTQYTRSFVLLNQFDTQSLSPGKLNTTITYEIEYEEAKLAIAELKVRLMARKEATDLFGHEKDNSFQSSLRSIVQTFDGQYLYPSIEEHQLICSILSSRIIPSAMAINA